MGFIEGVKKVWNKTVLPDKIDAIKERKKKQRVLAAEDAEWRAQIQTKARKGAKEVAEEKLVKQYKQQEVDRLVGGNKGKGKDWKKKLAEGFGAGSNTTDKNDKIKNMLGSGGTGSLISDEKIKKMLGGGSNDKEDSEDKVAKILGNKILGKTEEKKTKKKKTKKKKAAKKEKVEEVETAEETAEERIKRMLS